MKWSWRIAHIAGIDVNIHATFVLLVAWIAISAYFAAQSVGAALNGVAFVLALFLCVLLHEFGHALAARKYGITTRDITLLPIGGVAKLERMPEKPAEELQVALAGPATNILIAIVLFLALLFSGVTLNLTGLNMANGTFLERLLSVNVTLALFNLIPAFPMDGGRVVRALLATRMEYTRATQAAASLGQFIALIFGFIGLFSNPFLIFIALFVWIGAAQEASMVQMRSSLSGIPISRAMLTHFETLSPHDTLSRAVDLILAGFQHDFPVVENGRVAGILTRQGLMDALNRLGPSASVSQVMTHDYSTADAGQMLDQVSECLQTSQCRTVAVLRGGNLVGLLTMDNLGEFLMIQAALGERARAA